ncbi:MAG: ribbon-helix-helix protein, CopG family [Acidobacteriota bacterium]|nr:MAG: ribbon-helix-helix protein, CopG family [Acidobacteriota bacterium]
MYQRVNITLPEETLSLVDQIAEKGNRSRFIDQAIRYYVEAMSKARLKKLLKEGAIARAERDLKLAEEWATLEEEAWQNDRR